VIHTFLALYIEFTSLLTRNALRGLVFPPPPLSPLFPQIFNSSGVLLTWVVVQMLPTDLPLLQTTETLSWPHTELPACRSSFQEIFSDTRHSLDFWLHLSLTFMFIIVYCVFSRTIFCFSRCWITCQQTPEDGKTFLAYFMYQILSSKILLDISQFVDHFVRKYVYSYSFIKFLRNWPVICKTLS